MKRIPYLFSILLLLSSCSKSVYLFSSFHKPVSEGLRFLYGTAGALITIEGYYRADHRWFLAKGWSLENAFKWLYGGLSRPVDFIRWYTMHFIFKVTDGYIAHVSGACTEPVQPVVRDRVWISLMIPMEILYLTFR